jgi:tetratricopeptide (TPR) repeat protein
MTFVITRPPDDVPLPEPAKPWNRSRKLWVTLLILGALATAGIVWRKDLLYQYQQWTRGVHASRAASNLGKGDYDRAILDARRSLEFDPRDVEANRIIAKAHEAKGSLEAIPWRVRLNRISPGDVENALAWARGALKIGDADGAEDALAVLKPADRNSAAYHGIAAQIAKSRGDSAQAESHWSEAARLDPAGENHRLELAMVQLRSRSAVIRDAATKTLESLSAIPAHRCAALRALIEGAMNRRDFQRARELADRLIASPDASFSDRIGRLAVLRDQDAPDAPKYLEQLRDESLGNPEQLSTLLQWMNQHGLPLLVSDWMPGLPPALTSKPPVSLAVADAFGRGREWAKLRALTENAKWADFEHARLAHLARALENFGNVVAAETTWGRAVAECGEKPGRLAMLVRFAQAWRWDERAESTLRKLSADELTPLWVLDAMWAVAKKSGDAAELHRLSRLIVKARPKNPVARNNFVRLSLLRRSDEGTVRQLAAELFKERPTDITCAATQALSLFFEDKFYEAMKIMQSFPAAELREPEIALCYGILLHASGDSAGADEFLALARKTPLLREEEELIARVKRESRLNTLTPSAKKPAQQPKKAE